MPKYQRYLSLETQNETFLCCNDCQFHQSVMQRVAADTAMDVTVKNIIKDAFLQKPKYQKCIACSCNPSRNVMSCTQRVCQTPVLNEFECIDDDNQNQSVTTATSSAISLLNEPVSLLQGSCVVK